MIITLYAKAGCHLCDEARALIDDLAAEIDVELREVDIRLDTTLFERYRYRIPVLAINGIEALEGRFGDADLRAAAHRVLEPE